MITKVRADENDLKDTKRFDCYSSVIINCKIKILLLQKNWQF